MKVLRLAVTCCLLAMLAGCNTQRSDMNGSRGENSYSEPQSNGSSANQGYATRGEGRLPRETPNASSEQGMPSSLDNTPDIVHILTRNSNITRYGAEADTSSRGGVSGDGSLGRVLIEHGSGY